MGRKLGTDGTVALKLEVISEISTQPGARTTKLVLLDN